MPSSTVEPSDIFKCQQCGDCCMGFGGTFVTKTEIKAIADYLNIDPDNFVENYCQIAGGKPVLAQGKNAYCIFWDEICTIHPVKPRMCRTWPFIKSVLIDTDNWYIMAGICPGINTDVSDSEVIECVNKELSKDL